MINRRFVGVFLAIFLLTSVCLVIVWRLFLIEQRLDTSQVDQGSCAYEEIDLIMPVSAFLKRCAASPVHSYVRRIFINQWISYNQSDLIKLIVYAQGATTYAELKKALLAGMDKEGSNSGAAKFVMNSLNMIDEDPELMEHVSKSLVQGFNQKIHLLRGEIMNMDSEAREYRKLKTEYRKQLEKWIDEEHGELLDEIIEKL